MECMVKSKLRNELVKEVNKEHFVKELAAYMKKTGKVKVPEWVDIVKDGPSRELAPINDDWYYIRSAAVARHLYCRSPAGVGGLSKAFGGRYRRGVRPGVRMRSSRKILVKALQSLEGLKMVEKAASGHGRILTDTGRRDLHRIALNILEKEGKKPQSRFEKE